MYVLLISKNTRELIEKEPLDEYRHDAIEDYLEHKETWYLIKGYVSRQGHYHPYAILPGYMVEHAFMFDHEAAKTEWEMAFRLGD